MSTALRRSILTSALPIAAFGLMSLGAVGTLRAEEVIDPYAVRVEAPPPPAPPATTTTTTTTTQQTVQAPTVYPPPPAYPPPGTFGYQQPAPGQPSSNPPNYQQGYQLYPQNGGPPVYYAPPPAYPRYQPIPSYPYYPAPVVRPRPPEKKWDGVRRFSLGLHGTYMGLNQTLGGERLSLGGMGFQLRLRSAGRFGFEARQSFLRGSVWDGGFVRSSFPFTASFMFYLFPNQDSRHFNIYALAGVGAGMDFITLRNGPYGYPADQVFWSWIAQAGVGAELRFRWFAIEADVRAAGLFRDKNFGDGQYYTGVTSSAPVAARTLAVSGNVYLGFWF